MGYRSKLGLRRLESPKVLELDMELDGGLCSLSRCKTRDNTERYVNRKEEGKN